MEQKLLDLKEEFCKWYCKNKGIIIEYKCSGEVECNDCEKSIECDEIQQVCVNLCEECQIEDYIKHIRDELK